MISHTCCFTGHRELPADKAERDTIYKKTINAIRNLIHQGVSIFLVGGAVGYDTLAAEILFELREVEFPNIQIILVYPFDGFTSGWTPYQKAAYASTLPRYDKTVCVSQKAGKWVFLARDRYLVNHSSYCICYCTKDTGGTAYTVQYAQKRDLQILNITNFD